MSTVTERDFAHVADAEPVDERVAGLHLVDDPRDSSGQLDDGAVLGEDDAVAWNASLACEPPLRGEHPEFPVNRHDVAGTEQSVDGPDLLGILVPRRVHGRDLLMEHFGAA